MNVSETPQQTAYYPIRIVSSETGVNAITLRAWERRYGLLTPKRTATGHRLYTEQDIQLIRRIVTLLNRGIPISQAQAMVRNGDENQNSSTGSNKSVQWQHYRERLIESAQNADTLALNAVFDDVSRLFPLDVALRFLYLPVYRQLSTDAALNLPDQVRLQVYASFLQTRLAAHLTQASNQTDGRLLLVSLRQQDDLQPLLLSTLLSHQLYRPLQWVGGGFTRERLGQLLQLCPVAAVVLFVDEDSDTRELSQLQQQHAVPFFIYGQPQPASAVAGGLIWPGDNLYEAALTIRDTLQDTPDER